LPVGREGPRRANDDRTVATRPDKARPDAHRTAHGRPQDGPYADSFLLAPGDVQGPEVSAQFIPIFWRTRVCHFTPTFADTLSGEPITLWDRRAEPLVAYGRGVQAGDGLR